MKKLTLAIFAVVAHGNMFGMLDIADQHLFSESAEPRSLYEAWGITVAPQEWDRMGVDQEVSMLTVIKTKRAETMPVEGDQGEAAQALHVARSQECVQLLQLLCADVATARTASDPKDVLRVGDLRGSVLLKVILASLPGHELLNLDQIIFDQICKIKSPTLWKKLSDALSQRSKEADEKYLGRTLVKQILTLKNLKLPVAPQEHASSLGIEQSVMLKPIKTDGSLRSPKVLPSSKLDPSKMGGVPVLPRQQPTSSPMAQNPDVFHDVSLESPSQQSDSVQSGAASNPLFEPASQEWAMAVDSAETQVPMFSCAPSDTLLLGQAFESKKACRVHMTAEAKELRDMLELIRHSKELILGLLEDKKSEYRAELPEDVLQVELQRDQWLLSLLEEKNKKESALQTKLTLVLKGLASNDEALESVGKTLCKKNDRRVEQHQSAQSKLREIEAQRELFMARSKDLSAVLVRIVAVKKQVDDVLDHLDLERLTLGEKLLEIESAYQRSSEQVKRVVRDNLEQALVQGKLSPQEAKVHID